MSEIRSKKSEVRRQTSDIRHQTSDIKDARAPPWFAKAKSNMPRHASLDGFVDDGGGEPDICG